MSGNIGIIFAGGIGKRMGEKQIPKQFIMVDEKPIIAHTLDYFERHPDIDDIYIACLSSWMKRMNEILRNFGFSKVRKVIEGGVTAQHSIYNALACARNERDGDSIVLIHDGVRPFITSWLIDDLIESVKANGNGITCTPCQETIIESSDGLSVDHVPLRKDTWAAQAPQAFRLDDIMGAHDQIRNINPDYTNMVDACTIYKKLGREVFLVHGNSGNIKITNPEDVYILEGLMQYRKAIEIMGVSI